MGKNRSRWDARISNAERYTRVAIILHWLIAIGILLQIAIGWSMIDIPKNPPGVRVYWFNIHKSIGITLGMLILLRVVWRFTHGAPPLPAHIPERQRLAAKVSHFGLYACMVYKNCRGRDDGCPPPPARMRTGRIAAHGSCLR